MYAYIYHDCKQKIKNKPSMYVQEYTGENKQKIFRQKKIIVSKKIYYKLSHKGSSIMYVRSEGGGLVQLNAYWLIWGRFSCKHTYTIIYFSEVPQNKETRYELFRQPKLSIPIFPVQLESTTLIPRALLGFQT